jgi:hypothetical protein
MEVAGGLVFTIRQQLLPLRGFIVPAKKYLRSSYVHLSSTVALSQEVMTFYGFVAKE